MKALVGFPEAPALLLLCQHSHPAQATGWKNHFSEGHWAQRSEKNTRIIFLGPMKSQSPWLESGTICKQGQAICSSPVQQFDDSLFQDLRPSINPGKAGQNESSYLEETLRPTRNWPPIFFLFIQERHQEKYTALPNPTFSVETKKNHK